MITIRQSWGDRLSINPDKVSSLEWDRRFYVNGSSSTLVFDAYEIERQILAGQA